jgi:hypothetical protein
VRLAQDWLCYSLAAAARHYDFAAEPALTQLTNIPRSVQDFTLRQAYSDGPVSAHSPWVKDAAMPLYAYREGLAEPPDRRALSKAQLRSADADARFFVSENRIWSRGRPVETDIPLLLYLIFVIEKIVGRRQFPISRPSADLKSSRNSQRPPCGPAFELLRAAYALASVANHVMPAESETIYKTVRVARSDKFRVKLEDLRKRDDWFPTSDLSYADLIASRPAVCGLLYAESSRRHR